MARRLGIVTVGPIRSDPDLPAWLERELGRLLGVDTFAGPELEIHEPWRDPASGRLSANHVVDDLVRDLAPGRAFQDPDHPWALAITDEKLFAPHRPVLFGEATLGGPCALVSLAPLRSVDPDRTRHRALKESAHEFGHLLGLAHCHRPTCVMFPSFDIRDTDAKLEHPCDACARLASHCLPP